MGQDDSMQAERSAHFIFVRIKICMRNSQGFLVHCRREGGEMSTLPQQTPRPDTNGQRQCTDHRRKTDNGITQSADRRQQPDRRRLSGRRASDPSFQMERGKNAPAGERGGSTSQARETAAKSRLAAHVLSEDEVRFLLDDD